MSHFLVDCGYEQHNSFDWNPIDVRLPQDERISGEHAEGNCHVMEEIWDSTKAAIFRKLGERKRSLQVLKVDSILG